MTPAKKYKGIHPAKKRTPKAKPIVVVVEPKQGPPTFPFESAIGFLRTGHAVRRKAWHKESYIFGAGGEVFVRLPNFCSHTPQTWKPYANDILTEDWTVVGMS